MKQRRDFLKGQPRGVIDWEEVRRRIKAAGVAVEIGWRPDPEKKKEILRKRAETLAREKEAGEEGEYMEVLQFLLAYEKYAVESKYVREVCPLRDLTYVPCTPNFVLGIINVRGKIVSVIDIKKFFGLPERGLGDLNKVIILTSGHMEFGILADAIIGVLRTPMNAVQPSFASLKGIREDYLKGITGDRIAVLDGERLLSDKGIAVNEEV